MPNRPRKLRFYLFITAFFLLTAGASSAIAHDGLKIGVVNLDYIVAQSPSGKALQAKLEQFQKTVQEEAGRKTKAAQGIRQRIADGVNTLSEAKLQELQKQYEDAAIEIRRFSDDKQREGQKIQQEGLREIQKNLEPVFKAVRDEGGYDLILNNVAGVVVMAGEKADITQNVIDRLNRG